MKYTVSRIPEEASLAPETIPQKVLRTGAYLGSKALEGGGGIVGTLLDLPASLGNAAYGAATGKVSPVPSNIVSGTLGVPTPEAIHQKITKPLAEKYLPENYLEAEPGSWQETFGNIAEAAPTFGGGAIKNVLKAGLGEFAKEGVKKAGGGAVPQTAAYFLGASYPWGTGFSKEIDAAQKAGYSAWDEGISGVKGNPRKVEHYLSNLKNEFSQGTKSDKLGEAKTAALTEVDNILDKIKSVKPKATEPIPTHTQKIVGEHGEALELPKQKVAKTKPTEIEIESIHKSAKELNDKIYDPSIPKETKDQYRRVLKPLNEFIAEYGSKHPDAYAGYKIGQEITAAKGRAKDAAAFANEHSAIGKHLQTQWLKYLVGAPASLFVGLAPLTSIPTAAIASAATGIGIAGVKGLQEIKKFSALMNHSPIAKRLYMDAVKAAFSENAAGYAKALKQLDKVAGHVTMPV